MPATCAVTPVLSTQRVVALYKRLLAAYAEQGWWPAESPFEVMIGAVLTQNTAWTNVQRAITNLKQADCLRPEAMLALSDSRLAELIRPSGYYNVKTKRLRALLTAWHRIGGFEAMSRMRTSELRTFLLDINGIGPETADDILLYAFERPVFIIDTYTRRLLSQLGMIRGDEPYTTLQQAMEHALRKHTGIYGEYHALIVRHAKQKCGRQPGCPHCMVLSGKHERAGSAHCKTPCLSG